MDNLLSLGIDGWKCDGTDPYIYEMVGAKGYTGPVTYRYCDAMMSQSSFVGKSDATLFFGGLVFFTDSRDIRFIRYCRPQ